MEISFRPGSLLPAEAEALKAVISSSSSSNAATDIQAGDKYDLVKNLVKGNIQVICLQPSGSVRDCECISFANQ